MQDVPAVLLQGQAPVEAFFQTDDMAADFLAQRRELVPDLAFGTDRDQPPRFGEQAIGDIPHERFVDTQVIGFAFADHLLLRAIIVFLQGFGHLPEEQRLSVVEHLPVPRRGLRATLEIQVDKMPPTEGKPGREFPGQHLPALARHLGRMPIGTNVLFNVVRKGEPLQVEIAPREKGAVEGSEKAYERWGFTAKEINQFDTPELAFFAADGGIFVLAISWDGNASNSGLSERDIILTIDGKPVKTLDELTAIYESCMEKLPEKAQISLTVLRKGRKVQLVLKYLEDTEKEIVE